MDRRKLILLALGCASALLVGRSLSAENAAAARATIESKSQSTVAGTAVATEKNGGVEVVVDVTGASPGQHAVHIHEKGDCSAPDGTSAGGHFNPTGAAHGSPEAPEHHAGDFGNMSVGPDGKGHLVLTSKMLTVAPGPNSVVGRAVIVHEKLDDMKTQPTGNAGGRVGCGVFK